MNAEQRVIRLEEWRDLARPAIRSLIASEADHEARIADLEHLVASLLDQVERKVDTLTPENF